MQIKHLMQIFSMQELFEKSLSVISCRNHFISVFLIFLGLNVTENCDSGRISQVGRKIVLYIVCKKKKKRK